MDQIALLMILILPAISGAIGWILGRKKERYRDVLNIMMTGIEFLFVLLLYPKILKGSITFFIPDIMGIGLYLKLDGFRYIFIFITTFVWFLTTMYSTQYLIRYKNRNRYYAFFMFTLASTVGIFLSENILNLFTFFEIMSFTSYALIIHDEDQYAHDAGKSYLGMAIAAGMVLLMGLFLLYDYTATLNISELAEKVRAIGNIKYLISGLIIIGFGTKASMFPFHVWLPKAHPAAPTPASAVLSGILIKTGIFGIIVTVWIMMEGDKFLSIAILILGFINMFVGGFFALFQRNIKRILAYSSMSQAGYILVGIGLVGLLKDHKIIGIYGTLYHIFNHAIFKVLLFMGAGIIYMILHELSINVIRGFGKHKILLKSVFFVGLLAIIGMPGFNGFISKTLLHHALGEAHKMYHSMWWTLGEIVFTLSSGFTVAYLLKIFIAVFMEKNEKYKGQYKEHVRKRALFPMAILGIVVIFIGLRPKLLWPLIESAAKTFNINGHIEPHFYTYENVQSSIITILIGVFVYLGFIQMYLRKHDGDKFFYINPSLGWFNLERDFYHPMLRILFTSTSAIFHFLDRIVVNMVYLGRAGIKALSGIQIRREKYRKPGTKNAVDVKHFIKDIHFEFHSLSDVMGRAYNNANSLMYSLFMVAVILAIVLVILVF
ncbi:complex I subunit 5 family protein [Crassaminicella profunda]|uniref:complex I subunit 5 family protein n=1 Tax=Crassaminicella profunda TaxID=1286698 RepID=UPI001FE73869|nr:proton-conducting transporter membrane subunit [Crassaminicella profunda]